MIFSNSFNITEGQIDGDLKVTDAIFEAFLIEEACHFTDEQRKAFVESDLADTLVQEGRMRKNTLVRIGRDDDLSRRSTLASLQLAADNDDTLFKEYKKYRLLEKDRLAKIKKKYGFKSERIAKLGQKDYIKNRMPKAFTRISGFGSSDR